MDDKLILHFFISSLASSVFILLILLIKKGLQKHISTRWRYNMDLLFIVLMAIPFLPAGLTNFMNIGTGWLSGLFSGQGTAPDMGATMGGATQAVGGTNWLQDFSMSVDRASTGFIAPILLIIWLVGIIAMIVFTWHCNRELRLVVESMKQVEDDTLAALFYRLKAELEIKRRIMFGTSIMAKSPMTVGLFRTRIILPAETSKTSSAEDIRYILLHELTHCKNRDIPINNLMCAFQILYWFNPIVFFAFREMRLDRELNCDISVLRRLPEEQHVTYGQTLLRFVDKLSRPAILSFAAEIGGSKRQIKKRIESIVSFVKESTLLRIKSVCIFMLVGLFVLFQIPTVIALAASGNDIYRFHDENIVYEDLSVYFKDYEGSFVLYDLDTEQYTIHDKERSVTRVSPASTFKIYSALIALDTGVIDTTYSMRDWDGVTYPYEAWNKDQDLTLAMQNSVSWYFQEIDAQIGKQELAAYYTQLSYGNCDLSGSVSEYWMESSLRISPVEQVQLLRAFYQNDTIFEPEHVDALKGILQLTEKDGAVLSGKTGTGAVNGKVINGWFIGYVEKDGHTVLFATNIQGEDDAGGSAAVQITLDILRDKGIY